MVPFGRVGQHAQRALQTQSTISCQRRALTSQPSSKRVIFSGIQPTGIPHLGNYLGALSNWVRLQKSAERDDILLFSIVGWHALTLPQDPTLLQSARHDMLAVLLAIGIDPSTFDTISPRPQSASHGVVLDLELPHPRRKATANDDLEAADILIYRATHVPVGEDQRQHIELTRDLADIFNRSFSKYDQSPLFPLPEYIETPSKRVLSLKDPSSKMSKSSPDAASRILLTDTAVQIKAKIRGAVTDTIQGTTYDPVSRPGASNLLDILAACTNTNVLEVAKQYENKGHAHLKSDVTDAVEEMLKGPRAEFEKLRHDTSFLDEVAQKGAQQAMQYSGITLDQFVVACLSKDIVFPLKIMEREQVAESSQGKHNAKIPRSLSKGQERKVIEFLEYSFQDIESSFKKRSEPSLTKLPTLPAYLDAMQRLLAFILQIPPIDPSTSLRIAFLLRLTNDVMNSVPGYPPEMDDMQQLLDFLDDLDEAWLAVLNSQVWDPSSDTGADLVIPVDMIEPNRPIHSTPASQTERTRLHSLLVMGTAGLEEWLSQLKTRGEDYELALEKAGLMQGFNDLFTKTLAEMGGSASEPLIDPLPETKCTC
ncbi:hypothetical protein JVU11DRAFT_128 [Chiua virens]|nr:hypothetical protein JVU11DRAFT_128 [Chiua virens]